MMDPQLPAGRDDVESAYEALIRHWPRLRAWLEADEAVALWRRALPVWERMGEGALDLGRTRRRVRCVAAQRPRRTTVRVRPRPANAALAQDPAPVPAVTSQPHLDGELEVAHEALIRHWPRLRAWLDEDRAALLLREDIREAAQEWDGHGRDESYLAHRGRRLDEAAALVNHPRLELNALERAYLDAAVALHEREEHKKEAQRQRELAAERERAELAEQRAIEQAAAARALRRRLVVAGGFGMLATVAAIAAAIGFQQAGEQRDLAQQQSAAAEVAATEANRQTQIARAQALAAAALRQHDVAEDERGALLARQAFLFNQAVDGPVVAATDEALRAALGVDYFSHLLPVSQGPISAVAFGPDGETLAAAGEGAPVQLWRLGEPTADPVVVDDDLAPVRSLAFSPRPGAGMLAVARAVGVKLWHLDDPAAPPIVFSHGNGEVTAAVFDPEGQTLAVVSDGVVLLWNPDRAEEEPTALTVPEEAFSVVAISRDGKKLAAGGADGAVAVWDLSAPDTAPERFAGHESAVASVAFSPDGQTLGAGSDHVLLWRLDDPEAEPLALPESLELVTFSPDGELIAGDDFVGAHLWTTSDPEAFPTYLPGNAVIASLAFSPDGESLAAGGTDGIVRLWELTEVESNPIVLSADEGYVSDLTISSDGGILAIADWLGVRLWDLDEPVPGSVTLRTDVEDVYTVAVSPDGRTLATEGWDGQVQLWDLDHLTAGIKTLHDPPGASAAPGNFVPAVAFSPDSKTLAATRANGQVQLWDVASGSPMTNLDQPDGALDVTFSPDGRFLSVIGGDGPRLWALDDPGRVPDALSDGGDSIASVAFSPTAPILATGSSDGKIRLWDLTDPSRNPVILAGHDDSVGTLAFDPEGTTLASGSEDSTVRLWNLARLDDPPIVLRGQELAVRSVAFSPDGRLLAAGGENGPVRLWNPHSADFSKTVCRRVWRNLTLEEWRRFVGPEVPYERTCPNLPPGEGVVPAEGAAATPVSGETVGFRPGAGGLSFLISHSPVATRATRL